MQTRLVAGKLPPRGEDHALSTFWPQTPFLHVVLPTQCVPIFKKNVFIEISLTYNIIFVSDVQHK